MDQCFLVASFAILYRKQIGGAFLRAFLRAFLAFLRAFLAFLRLLNMHMSERQKGLLKRYIAAATYKNRVYPVKYRGIL